jgi:4'-phosphopantetheinyl transferase
MPGLASGWLLPLAAWRSEWPGLASLVTAEQRRRFAGIRDGAKRRDRLLAAALHRHVLSRALGWAPDQLPLYRSTLGQPRLALPGLHTSLAHADGVVAIALSLAGPVGVDVEMRDAAPLQPIADLVCAPDEFAALMAVADGDRDARLLELWVRKEAVLKAAGIGLACPMASFVAPVGTAVRLRGAQGEPVEVVVDMFVDRRDCVAAIAAPLDARPRWHWYIP